MRKPLYLASCLVIGTVFAACSSSGGSSQATTPPAPGDTTKITVAIENNYGSGLQVSMTPVNARQPHVLGTVHSMGGTAVFYVDYYPQGFTILLLDEAQGVRASATPIIPQPGAAVTLIVDMNFKPQWAGLQR